MEQYENLKDIFPLDKKERKIKLQDVLNIIQILSTNDNVDVFFIQKELSLGFGYAKDALLKLEEINVIKHNNIYKLIISKEEAIEKCKELF